MAKQENVMLNQPNPKYFTWDRVKNSWLQSERNISFEQIVVHIEVGDLLDIIEHPNQEKYPHQQIYVINLNGYVYLVPFYETSDEIRLITAFPSRKATRDYLP